MYSCCKCAMHSKKEGEVRRRGGSALRLDGANRSSLHGARYLSVCPSLRGKHGVGVIMESSALALFLP